MLSAVFTEKKRGMAISPTASRTRVKINKNINPELGLNYKIFIQK
jgi:hypothetical protein